MSASESVQIRDARDEDADGLIALIGGVFDEYPGCVMDVDGEIPELRAIATAYREWGGHFWVAELAGKVVGCVGFAPSKAEGGVELKKLYVDRTARRMGLGSRLCDLVERAARARAARFVDLWSDTRFSDAHRLYEKRGFQRGPGCGVSPPWPDTRELHDKSDTVEYYFRRDL